MYKLQSYFCLLALLNDDNISHYGKEENCNKIKDEDNCIIKNINYNEEKKKGTIYYLFLKIKFY